MKRTKIIVAIAIFGLTFSVGAQNTTDQGKGFYERKSEGWFWYETEPEEKSMGSDSNQSSLTPLNLK